MRAALETLLEKSEEPVFPVEGERYLRDENGVDVSRRDGRGTGNEPRVAPHELDHGDAVLRSRGFHVRPTDDVDRRCVGGLEAEAAIDEVDIVVDRLRDSNDANEEIAPGDLRRDLHGSFERAVSSDDEQDADVELVQAIHHFARILIAARRSEGRTSDVVNVGHGGGGQLDGFMAEPADEAFVSVPKTEDVSDAVALSELEDDASDDVV